VAAAAVVAPLLLFCCFAGGCTFRHSLCCFCFCCCCCASGGFLAWLSGPLGSGLHNALGWLLLAASNMPLFVVCGAGAVVVSQFVHFGLTFVVAAAVVFTHFAEH